MEQKKTGAFLAQMRKEKEMTQMELAEVLGVTNKTISRWETGTYMPDLGMIPVLCEVLGISINEFLAGERLEEEAFRQQAEENVAHMLNREAKIRKMRHLWSMLSGAGTGMLFSSIYAPASIARGIVVIAAIIMINISWILEKRIVGDLLAAKGTDLTKN